MKKLLVVLIAYCLLPIAYSQAPQSWTSAEMYQALRKLNVLGSVLYVAAHPDDENTRLIAYLSKDKLYRTGYLSMTRGDGGQNLIGDEQGIELGLIRTQELLSARRIDGGEQFFSRAIDFGYSKTPEETFAKWDKEKILSDVVWIIRKFQPDVIITRFPTTGEGGHGHHTANEAFSAAADPNRFPEQLKFVSIWQVKRILWNTFNFGGTNTQREDQYKLDVGGYNPLLGKSYGEIAATSRSQHKSQGFGVPAGRGEALEYFKATKGDQPANDLLDGVDQTWKRVKGGEAIEKLVDSISTSFDFLHPEKSVKSLVKLFQSIKSLPDGYWRNKKLEETQQLIEQCSGLFLEATTNTQFAVKTDSVKINFSFNDRLGVSALLSKVTVTAAQSFDTSFNVVLAKNKNFNFSKTVFVHPLSMATQPYWLINKMDEGHFNVFEQQDIGKPDVDPTYWMMANIKIEGMDMVFTKPVKYKFTDPVRGELYEPLVVIPSMLLTSQPSLRIVINKDEKLKGEVSVQNKKNNISATVQTDYFLLNKKEDPSVSFNIGSVVMTARNQTITVGYSAKGDSSVTYRFLAKDNNMDYYSMSELKEIKYDHIPYIDYSVVPTVDFRKVDVKTYNKKIGYIVGAGDKVPDALEQMGYEVTLLSDKNLSKNHLDQFDAIITGVRAYNTNEWMNNHYDKLMKYVNDGGNLIVQYNTSNQIGPVRAKISPYNFDISRTRITDENAAVIFLRPEHPVMNFPNKITQDDFKGWIQERSIYHAAGYDSTKFQTIFSMNDPGENPDAGSLIIAKYGKGWFTYTGLVFFRELPAGVSGAYRLLANIIALNKKKAF
jgi:LmbE family N-acetylglucosaminyl deacetylase